VVPVLGAAVMGAVLALSSTTALIVGLVWLAIGIVVPLRVKPVQVARE
jgi:hypothetical protein